MTPTNVEKRKEREEAEESSPGEWKRQKVTERIVAKMAASCVGEVVPSQQQQHQIKPFVGANELASAFALASLATMSPTQNNLVSPSAAAEFESRDADNDEGSELEPPSAVPISPDVRSPVRSAAVSAASRRVTFSEDTKISSRITSRRLSLPSRVMVQSKKQHTLKSRIPPPGFGFGQNHFFPPYASRPPNTPPLPPPHWAMQPGMRHHGPPSLFMPPLHARPDATSEQHKWICDFCNVASFETYEEACVHEDHCRARPNHSWSHPPPNAATLRAVHRMRRNLSMAQPSPYGVADGKVPTLSPGNFGTSPSTEIGETIRPTVSNVGSGDMNDVESSPRNSSLSDQHSRGQLNDGDPIVLLDDMALVPPYVYFLMRQVEITHFTEADRFVARSKGPVGYSGFQCRHCHGHAGLGKYFPVTAKSLSTNSTSQNIHSHLLKCRKVAPFIKEQLLALKEEKSKAPRLEPGWRRIFFEKIWSRLHD